MSRFSRRIETLRYRPPDVQLGRSTNCAKYLSLLVVTAPTILCLLLQNYCRGAANREAVKHRCQVSAEPTQMKSQGLVTRQATRRPHSNTNASLSVTVMRSLHMWWGGEEASSSVTAMRDPKSQSMGILRSR